MTLTNTIFQHQIKHRTTLQAPETPNRNHENGELRRHPVGNQIDYIIVRRRDLNSIHDSRSYTPSFLVRTNFVRTPSLKFINLRTT